MTQPEKNNQCWSVIGITGDASCPELKRHIHCRNCPVYVEGGRGLLDREMTTGYLKEWTDLLARAKEQAPAHAVSLIVFRAGSEWFGLPTKCFSKIAPERPIHRIPHRSGRVLLGVANIDGELLLCASLHGLMGLEREDSAGSGEETRARMIVTLNKGRRWVFPVEEVDAIHHVPADELDKPPVTAAKAAVSFTSGLFTKDDKMVAVLKEEVLFDELRRMVTG
ncbi:MAG: chemotaxis protein CheW [Lentisphaerota bacterium]